MHGDLPETEAPRRPGGVSAVLARESKPLSGRRAEGSSLDGFSAAGSIRGRRIFPGRGFDRNEFINFPHSAKAALSEYPPHEPHDSGVETPGDLFKSGRKMIGEDKENLDHRFWV
jgi:hypothetical protein